jgi:hypothetical protein
MKPFAAEVLFLDPADVPPAAAALREAGLDFKVDPHARDEGSEETVFAIISGSLRMTSGIGCGASSSHSEVTLRIMDTGRGLVGADGVDRRQTYVAGR